jgi:EAL domain-containing protein (putative c-di-GMP-specific phosphodiesterase class I)
MIGMAQDLGYEVVAEGVEDSQTWAFLKDLGCGQVQGYLVSRPLTVDYFEQWLDAELPID